MRPPVVYESHGIGAEFSGALDVMLSTGVSASSTKRRRLDGRERRVWNRADGYITLTRRLSHLLTDRYGPRDRVAAIPDGVSLPSDRRFEPPRFGPHPLVGYAGHLYPWKGVDLLVEALALTPDVRGIIVGGHPAEPDLARVQALAARLGVTRVTFTGLVDPPRVAALLSEADLLVLPNRSTHVSATSTSPLKLFEYLALGKPIVASDLPALREVLRDGDNAVLVEPDSAAALARGLQTVVSDARLAERLARHAFDEAEQYTWERRAERVEALLVQAGAAATR
jgi:glycosyltransferase involved in cell wall biosynthesis